MNTRRTRSNSTLEAARAGVAVQLDALVALGDPPFEPQFLAAVVETVGDATRLGVRLVPTVMQLLGALTLTRFGLLGFVHHGLGDGQLLLGGRAFLQGQVGGGGMVLKPEPVFAAVELKHRNGLPLSIHDGESTIQAGHCHL